MQLWMLRALKQCDADGQLVTGIGLRRLLSKVPLCLNNNLWHAMQVELNLLEAEAQFGVNMEGLQVESFEISPGTAIDDLYLVLGRVGKSIAGRMEYNAALFKPETVACIAADWQVLLPSTH